MTNRNDLNTSDAGIERKEEEEDDDDDGIDDDDDGDDDHDDDVDVGESLMELERCGPSWM